MAADADGSIKTSASASGQRQEIIVYYNPEAATEEILLQRLGAAGTSFEAYRKLLRGPGCIRGEVSGEDMNQIMQQIDMLRNISGVTQVMLAGMMRPQ